MITLFVYVLATARMVRLLTEDKITEAWRKRWLAKHPKDTMLGYLATCAWCTSIWLAALPAVAWVVAPEHPVLKSAAALLAFSWLAVAAHKLLHLLDAKIQLFAPPAPAEKDEVTDGQPA